MKNLILAVILIVAAVLQNIASAAEFNSIDWDNAPHFGNKADFIKYIENCESTCKNFIPVVFENGLYVELDEFLKITKQYSYANVTWWDTGNGRREKVLYETGVYPGAKVVQAYRTGDSSQLSAEEKQLLNLAVQIVNESAGQPTTLLREYYLHDAITSRASYYTANSNAKTPRYCTAIGALIDGRANCQGYSDSFYMLATMAGFNVSKMSGYANNKPHVWNTINFGDGKIYAVDVTFDDASFSDGGDCNNYIYFNAPLEIIRATHTWDTNYNPQLQPKIDGRYFYATPEFGSTNGKYFGFHSETAEHALYYTAQRIAKEGYQLSLGMAPYDRNYANTKFALNRLVREILPKQYNWYGAAKMSISRRGNWLFYLVEVANKN